MADGRCWHIAAPDDATTRLQLAKADTAFRHIRWSTADDLQALSWDRVPEQALSLCGEVGHGEHLLPSLTKLTFPVSTHRPIQISAHSSPRLASSNNSTAFAGSCPASFSSRYTNGYRSLMSATVDAHSCLSLVALLTWRDLLFCAKHLFVAAIGRRCAHRAAPRTALPGGMC